MTSDRDELANMLPLGYHPPQDKYRNVFEAADAILASDWLARVKADAWDAGARWAYEEITGEPEKRFELAPGDNPHREDGK